MLSIKLNAQLRDILIRTQQRALWPSSRLVSKSDIPWTGARYLRDLSERRKKLESKYANKLSERVQREGVANVEELMAKVLARNNRPESVTPKSRGHRERHEKPPDTMKVRKDNFPVKPSSDDSNLNVPYTAHQPLADFMNLKRIMSKNQTTEEVSALWMAYHASLSKEKRRVYMYATIPLHSYSKMISLASKYSSFLLPLPRPPRDADALDPVHEFHFLQWGFHSTPPHPMQTPLLPFEESVPPALESPLQNPPYTTVLFTPLQEYKLRQTFAQPNLVLTNYTDLAITHGIVLMRGELTPSPSSPDKCLLSQEDAQLLATGVQRYYLPMEGVGSVQRLELLRRFHETPADFRWEELLAFADPTT